MTDRDQKLRDVVELSSRMVDDQLDAAGVARLEALLFGDPEACELYLNVTTLHAHLMRDLGTAVPADVMPAGMTAAPAHPSAVATPSAVAAPATRRRFGYAAAARVARYAAAACLALFVGLVSVLAVRSQLPPGDACVTIEELRGPIVWAECSQPHRVGDRLAPQTIGLTTGTVVVRFDSGAVATLTGPFELLIENRRGAELKSGCVLVRSDRDQTGFTLKTAASNFVDLGGEFGVAVNPDGSSEVHVFEGPAIARPQASDAAVPVLGNEAGRVEPERGDVVSIEVNRARFTGVMTPSPLNRPATLAAAVRTQGPLPPDARVVYLGDRATDLETHLLLIDQALARLHPDGGPRPRLFNAAASVPLAFDEGQVRRYVLTHRPTHAVIEFGPEIATSPRPTRRTDEQFERDVRRLLERLAAEGIEPILSTGFTLGQKQAQCQGVLDGYNRVLRRIAAEDEYRLADVDAHFRSLSPYKLSLVAPNGATPTFGGYQQIAAVQLAALGYLGAKIDPAHTLSLLPGAITQWRYRLKPSDDRLDLDPARAAELPALAVAAAAAVRPATNPAAGGDDAEQDGRWRDLTLPQPEDKFCARYPEASHALNHRDRARGFATNLFKGKDTLVEAVATVESSEDRRAFLNTGAEVRAVWLNGRKVFDGHGRPGGWHAGTERVLVELRAGRNALVVEAGASFFVSVTDDFDWPVQ